MFEDDVLRYEKEFKRGQIIDGLVDPSKYQKANYKIAWFLKEAYTTEEDGWHIKKYYSGEDAYDDFFRNIATTTWHPIIYSSYGILNDFQEWDDMSYIRDKPEMCQVVSSIAIINANKWPSKTGTFTLYKNLVEGFQQSKSIIEKQIDILKPEIHIFGSTFFLYKEMFGLEANHLKETNPVVEVWEKDGKLFLNTYHPANRIVKREDYVNRLVGAVKKWNQPKT